MMKVESKTKKMTKGERKKERRWETKTMKRKP
jgi:hypothetical protein